MTDPFSNPSAFAPLFNETVVVTGYRPEGAIFQALSVCVMTDADADPIGDDKLDTEIDAINCLCNEDSWRFVSTLRRGDILTRKHGAPAKYAVQSVKRDAALGLIIKARSC